MSTSPESDDALTLRRLRTFLLLLAAALYAGAVAELVFVEHTEDPAQLIPFGLCALGLLSVLAYASSRSRATLLAARGASILVILGSVVGMYFHLNANIEIARETMPGADSVTLFLAGLSGGNPLFAPGICAVAAVLVWATTWNARRARS